MTAPNNARTVYQHVGEELRSRGLAIRADDGEYVAIPATRAPPTGDRPLKLEPASGQVWRFLGNDDAPPMSAKTIVSIDADRGRANFDGLSCATLRWMRELPEWEYVGMAPVVTAPWHESPRVPSWKGSPFQRSGVSEGGFASTAVAGPPSYDVTISRPSQWQAFGALCSAVSAVASHLYAPWLAGQQRGAFAEARVAALCVAEGDGANKAVAEPADLDRLIAALEVYEAKRDGLSVAHHDAFIAASESVGWGAERIDVGEWVTQVPGWWPRACSTYERARSTPRAMGRPGRAVVRGAVLRLPQ